MKAVLWDGFKQIEGELEFTIDSLHFIMKDFHKTNLELKMLIADIQTVRRHKIYDLTETAIEVVCKGDRKNVFVVEDAELLMVQIMMSIR